MPLFRHRSGLVYTSPLPWVRLPFRLHIPRLTISRARPQREDRRARRRRCRRRLRLRRADRGGAQDAPPHPRRPPDRRLPDLYRRILRARLVSGRVRSHLQLREPASPCGRQWLRRACARDPGHGWCPGHGHRQGECRQPVIQYARVPAAHVLRLPLRCAHWTFQDDPLRCCGIWRCARSHGRCYGAQTAGQWGRKGAVLYLTVYAFCRCLYVQVPLLPFNLSSQNPPGIWY